MTVKFKLFDELSLGIDRQAIARAFEPFECTTSTDADYASLKRITPQEGSKEGRAAAVERRGRLE